MYYIGISGELTGYGPYEIHRDAYHMRQVIIAGGEAYDNVIITYSSSSTKAREVIQQWHTQCAAAKSAEEGTSWETSFE